MVNPSTAPIETPAVRPLIVTHSLTMGGAERFAANLATHLRRPGFQPALFVASDGLGYPVAEDVELSTHGYRGYRDLLRVRRELRARLREGSAIDVVLSNVLSTSCLVAAARGRTGIPWVARIGLAPERGDRGVQGFLASWVYPWATCLVSNSREMAKAVEDRYPGVRGRVRALPNPTDFAALDRRAEGDLPEGARQVEGELRLLAVGRLTEQKRFDLALRALAEVRRVHPARLWLAGRGPLERELRTLASELGVGDAVDWLGFCDNPFPLMRHADLFLLSSDFEGLPNALIEAQGLGLAAVATRCPYGPSEIVSDGVTGRLVPPGNAEALATAIVEVASKNDGDTDWLTTAGPRAADRARARYDLSVLIPRWEELLQAVASGAAPEGRV